MREREDDSWSFTGCSFILGLIVLSCAIGALYGGAYGWLTFGGGLIGLWVVSFAVTLFLTR